MKLGAPLLAGFARHGNHGSRRNPKLTCVACAATIGEHRLIRAREYPESPKALSARCLQPAAFRLFYAALAGADVGNPLCRAPSAGFSQFRNKSVTCRYHRSRSMHQRKSRTGHGFSRKLTRHTAQNPVTRLWTGCTRLKNRYLQIDIFH